MKNLLPRDRINIEDVFQEKKFTVRVDFESTGMFHIACFCLDDNEKMPSKGYMVFPKNLKTPDGMVQLSTATDNHAVFELDLHSFPGQVRSLIFVGVADKDCTLAELSEGTVTFLADGQEEMMYRFQGTDFVGKKTLILFGVYHRGAIKIKIINQTFTRGLDFVINRFSYEVNLGAKKPESIPASANVKEDTGSGGISPSHGTVERSVTQWSFPSEDEKHLATVNKPGKKNRGRARNQKVFRDMVEEKKGSSLKYVIWAVVCFIFVLVFLKSLYGQNAVSFLKEMQVSEVKIVNMLTDAGRYYVKISYDPNTLHGKIPEDNLYVQVPQDFYAKRRVNDSVGVLFGNYEIYRNKYFGKGKKMLKSEWTVDNIYDSYQSALEANQTKQLQADAEVSQKKLLENGASLLILKYNEGSFAVPVEKGLFDKVNVGQKVKCAFEERGEMTKLLSIMEEG